MNEQKNVEDNVRTLMTLAISIHHCITQGNWKIYEKLEISKLYT